ncbi:MAG: InlB B-repeat-containing protein [Lachnospiraceae bacterium]|nr:InlB B-repeat-containing protein [Lachnospiraceae bacterium]
MPNNDAPVGKPADSADSKENTSPEESKNTPSTGTVSEESESEKTVSAEKQNVSATDTDEKETGEKTAKTQGTGEGTDNTNTDDQTKNKSSEPDGVTSGKTEITKKSAPLKTVSPKRTKGAGDSGDTTEPVVAAASPENPKATVEKASVTVTQSAIPGIFSYSYVDEPDSSAESSVTLTGNMTVTNLYKRSDGTYDTNWWDDYPELPHGLELPQVLIDLINSIAGDASSVSAGGILAVAHSNYPAGSTDYVAGSGASSSVNVGGKLTVEAKDKATGIAAGALGTGNTASVDVKGGVNVSAGGTAVGLDVRSKQDGTTTVSAGSVTAKADDATGIATGIKASATRGASAQITIGGDVQALTNADAPGGTIGVTADNSSGSIEISVDGSMFSGGAGICSTGEAGSSTVLVRGDVEAGTTGAKIMNETDGAAGVSAANHVILVENTLAGDEQGILVSRDSVQGLTGVDKDGNPVDKGGALDVTVWQIVKNDRGNVAEIETADGYKAAEKVEKAIKYIIKFEQPAEGGTLSVTDKDKQNLETSHGFEVARETERVLLKVDLKTGYKIIAAYNGLGEKEKLLMDSDGNYYIDVPKGGGVYLTVELGNKYKVRFVDDDNKEEDKRTLLQEDEIEYGKTPSYKGKEPVKKSTVKYTYSFAGWTPDINPVTGDITYTAVYDAAINQYTLTFDPAGGTLNGKTSPYTMTADYDSTVNLADAPTRDGYRFLYWKGSEYQAGASYTVKGDHTFTAVWEKEEDEEEKRPASGDDAEADHDHSDDDDSGSYKSPKTADESRTELWILLVAAAGLGFVTALTQKKRSGF